MDTVVATYLGQSNGLGMIASLLTQLIKITESIPTLSNYASVRWLLSKVSAGNDGNIHICVAVIATILNGIWLYTENGTMLTVPMVISTFGSFLAALGSHSVLASYAPKNTPLAV